MHVNYAEPPDPGVDDKDLVIPLANHVAVVAHTRRLLRETVYLQDYLEQLIEQANALIIATDPEGQVTVWNRAMHRVTGFSRAEVLGKPLLPWLTQLGAPDVGPGAQAGRRQRHARHPRGPPAHRGRGHVAGGLQRGGRARAGRARRPPCWASGRT